MASGDTLLEFTPLAGEPPATLFATPGVRNNHPILEFDASTAWSIYFSAVLPRNYGGGGLTITIHWMAATATTGSVMWGTAIERMNTDLDADSFAAQSTANGTANGTSGIETVTSTAHTSGAQMDGLTAGDQFRVQLQRVAADASDTMAGNAQLVTIELRET